MLEWSSHSPACCRFEAAWKDPECDRIYEHLRREMEIDRRYEALEDKVGAPCMRVALILFPFTAPRWLAPS